MPVNFVGLHHRCTSCSIDRRVRLPTRKLVRREIFALNAELHIAVLCCLALAGCSSPFKPRDPNIPAVRITPDNAEHPQRIRFDVYGKPYAPALPGSEESKLPMHLQIQAGMRRFAAEKLAELGYCPNGFSGPAVVLAPENNVFQRFFFVECLRSSEPARPTIDEPRR